MPPKAQFTKEQILETAFDIATQEGLSGITVRKIAQKMSCSVAPIYVNFKNSSDLLRELKNRIESLLWEYITKKYTDQNFFNIGLGQIHFAKDYPKLYLDLLMSNDCFEHEDQDHSKIMALMHEDHTLQGLTHEQRLLLLQQMSLITDGITLKFINNRDEKPTMEQVYHLLDITCRQLISSQIDS